MSILVLLTYTGKDSSARKFAEEMERSGTAALIRREDVVYDVVDSYQSLLEKVMR